MRTVPRYQGRKVLLILLLTLLGYDYLNVVSSLSVRRDSNNRNVKSPSSRSTTLPTNDPSMVSRRGLIAASLIGTSSGILWKETPALAETGGSQQQPLIIPKLGDEYFTNPVGIDPEAGRSYFPALTPPFSNRATYKYDLGRDFWALEQLLTFANVTATIRCNVVRLQSTGGLWVHSPQWPTGEFCSLLDGIGGEIEHVVLPCNAFEHKAPMKAFLEKYPKARVWIAPGQYGPLGKGNRSNATTSARKRQATGILMVSYFVFLLLLFVGHSHQGSCGTSLSDKTKKPNMGYRVDGIFGDKDSPPPPWSDEFDIATLYVDLPRNAGPSSEVAFCHRPSRTLITTDAVVYIPSEPSEILSTYFDKETMGDPYFWPKSVLQAVFLPLRTEETKRSESNGAAFFYYPGYEALVNRLARAPILRAVVDARAPDAVKDWILEQTITSGKSWNYDRVITSHFASPIKATPSDVRASFDYLFKEDLSSSDSLPPIACRDWELLDSINQFIANYNAGEPAVFDFQRGCVAD